MISLDNVIWQALTTRHSGFSQGAGNVRRFMPEVGPLAAFTGDEDKGYDDLYALTHNGGAMGIFSVNTFAPRKGWEIFATAPLFRMVREKPLEDKTVNLVPLAKLGAADSAEMMELTALVKPGPFSTRTHELGDFYGIRVDGKLVAMAGERLKVPGHTEVSAVCTHPDHIGKGYAAAAMRQVIAGIEKRGETPFLHVRGDNDRAVELYERLGFRTLWKGHFAAFRKE